MSRGDPGFRRLRRGESEVWVSARFERAAEAAGLFDADAVLGRLTGAAAPDGRGPVARVALGDGIRIVLRRILHGGILGPLLGGALAGMARPRRELETTAALLDAGAPVPTPVLAVGRRGRAGLWRAALATVEIPDSRSARELLTEGIQAEELLSAAAAAGSAVRRFHDAGGRHADLHLGNLLLQRGAEGFEVRVIDLDRSRCGAPPDASRRMAELGRLYRSAVKRGVAPLLDSGGTRAFLDAYVGDDAALLSALLAHRARESRRLRLHRLHYRRG